MEWSLRKMELWVGSLAGGGIVLFLGLLVMQGGVGQMMGSFLQVVLYMPRSYNVRSGTPVKMLDFSIGTVKEVALQEDRRVRVSLQLRKEYLSYIRQNSVAVVRSTLIGESSIEIKPGDPRLPQIKAMEQIPFEPASDKIEAITTSALTLVNSLTSERHSIGKMLQDQGVFFEKLYGTLKNVESITGEFKKTVEMVNSSQGTLGALLQDQGTLFERLHGTLKNVESITGEFKKTVQTINSSQGTLGALLQDRQLYDKTLELQDQSKALVEKLRTTIDQVNTILKDLAGTTQQLPDLMRTGAQTASGVREAVDALKRIWPISAAMGEPPQDELLEITPRMGN